MGSTNGTFVDELRLGEIYLEDGVHIHVGNTILAFHASSSQPKPKPVENILTTTIVGHSGPITAVFEQIKKVAPTELSMIIEGETGTGKELVASAIHANSRRANKPFVVFDCSAFPPTLIESELFGHEKGAFTGAQQRKIGKFELAHGGTILLDEISEMELPLQAKLLRVLQEREVDRVGGKQPIPVDVRVVATTNRNIEESVQNGDFRADLFYRLNVIPIVLPSLRERPGDIKLLAEHFMRQTLG
ncbi:MAG: sigma-54 factor interaction domain-containing protein, partial [Myxococcales bacterium]|nr:sigma-54 factor interaction domain-containing protein [Myxococcales bacterium]